MIRGHVSATLEPVIDLSLVQGDMVTVIPAIIDTGFSGMLCLAERYLAQIDLKPPQETEHKVILSPKAYQCSEQAVTGGRETGRFSSQRGHEKE